MRRRTSARIAQWAALAALSVGVFEACTDSTDSTVLPPKGPEVLSFADPATDSADDAGLTTLGCDNTLVVHLNPQYWMLRPPFTCGTFPQCGSVRVTLLNMMDDTTPLATESAATPDVQLDLTSLVNPPAAGAPTLSDVHFLKAELISDSFVPVPPAPGIVVSVVMPIALSSTGCSAEGGAGGASGAAPGTAGAGGATPGEGGGSAVGGSGGSSAGSGGSGGLANEAGADGVDTTVGGATP
jgi:hypothetical protein